MLVDVIPEGLANTHKNIAEHVPGASVATFQADVSDATKAIRSVEETLRAFTRLDILVNNASMRNYSAIGDAKPEEWQAMASVNLIGTANYCRQLCRPCAKPGAPASSTYHRPMLSLAAKAWDSTTPPRPACSP